MINQHPLKPLVFCLAILFGDFVWAEETKQAVDKTLPEKKLDTVVVEGSRIGKDEIGYNRVYTRDIVSLYKGKKELETYKGNTVSDLLTGMVGVYSGDARNSGALDPNIRNVQGEGRIPVTVDGTEQAITVWRGYAGVNNRNYVDPSLISSVYVEKGPSLNPKVHSGIGGSIAMKTIDADDIVQEGKKYGFEVKVETGNNSIKPLPNAYANSVDYRTLANPNDITAGMWRLFFGKGDRQIQRFDGKNDFFKDRAIRIAAATKQENFDATIAYAYRNKGNYFSGTKGGDKYGQGKDPNMTLSQIATQMPIFVPWTALLFKPGSEVTNTSLNSSSWLGKVTFKLPDQQKIKLGARYTDMRFGEIMPSRLGTSLDTFGTVLQWPEAWVKQQAYNLDYSWHPENSRWINLDASLWTTRTNSKTNSAGGAPGDVLYIDGPFSNQLAAYNGFLENADKVFTPDALTKMGIDPKDPDWKNKLIAMGIGPKKPSIDDALPNTDNRFNTVAGEAYFTKNNRVGLNIANKMKLHNKLELTVMGNIQRETLKGHSNFDEFHDNPEKLFSDGLQATARGSDNIYYNTQTYNIATPRNGKRQEWSMGFNFKFTPTDWLILNAGARYTSFNIKDDYVKKYLATNYKGRGPQTKMNQFIFDRKMTAEEMERHKQYEEAVKKANARRLKDYPNNGIGSPYYWEPLYLQGAERDYYLRYIMGEALHNRNSKHYDSAPKALREEALAANKKAYAEGFEGGQPVYDNTWSEALTLEWKYDKYGRLIGPNPLVANKEKLREKIPDPSDPSKMINKYNITSSFIPKMRPLNAEEKKRIGKQEGHGWAPSFSATILLSDSARIYARYSEHLRYPSIFEGTLGFSTQKDWGKQWLPEHAKNWEIGYVQDLTPWISSARYADVRLNYFHNTTKNITDRDNQFVLQQYDKQLRTGIELQSRFDFGRVFGDIGVTRNLRNRVCDQQHGDLLNGNLTALPHRIIEEFINGKRENFLTNPNDPPLYQAPICANAGLNPTGYLANFAIPQWSVTANLGTRLLNNKLELGSRFTYHSHVHDTYERGMIEAGYDRKLTEHWQPVMVFDAYARYQINKNFSVQLSGNNLTNRYYLDPLTNSQMPAPGRTIQFGLTGKF